MSDSITQGKAKATKADIRLLKSTEDENIRQDEAENISQPASKASHSSTLFNQLTCITKQANQPAFIPKVTPSRWVQDRCAADSEYLSRYDAAIKKVLSLSSRTEFKEHFRPEHTAYENEKNRAKTLDPRLSDFRNWLIHMGPRPAEGWSVDRYNPKRGYDHGNMQWNDHPGQTENRRITRWHKLPDGRQLTTAQLAKYIGVKYDTLRKALRRGNTVEQLIDRYGVKINAEHAWRFPPQLQSTLDPEYLAEKKAGQSRLAWYCNYLPRWIKELRSAGVGRDKIERLNSHLHEAEEELAGIRNIKKIEKHKLAFAVLHALTPQPQEQHAPFTKEPASIKLQQPPIDEGLTEEHPAYGVVATAARTPAKPAPIKPLVKAAVKNAAEDDDKPMTYEELLAFKPLGKYNVGKTGA